MRSAVFATDERTLERIVDSAETRHWVERHSLEWA